MCLLIGLVGMPGIVAAVGKARKVFIVYFPPIYKIIKSALFRRSVSSINDNRESHSCGQSLSQSSFTQKKIEFRGFRKNMNE